MEDLADVIKRQEDHSSTYLNVNSAYLWCYKPHEEWLLYPSSIEYMIESKFQAYCQGEMSCHGEFVVGGEDVVLDYQHMVQYTQTALFASPTTCRIKRVQVTMDMKIKLTAHQCMEVEHMALFGLQEMAAEEAYNTWTHTFHSLAMARQPHDAFQTSGTQLYRVLSEKSPVHSFPSLNQPVHCVAPNGEAYSGVFQIGASRQVDEELVHMVNRLRETSGRCVTNLMVADIYASLHGKHKDYPYLSIFPIPAITGRLDVLRAINMRLAQCLMFVGIGLPSAQPDWLGGIVLQAKSCLFLETKMHVW
ncbi:hypothetical protein DYB30_014116, partial [Aphanomyces astaci]